MSPRVSPTCKVQRRAGSGALGNDGGGAEQGAMDVWPGKEREEKVRGSPGRASCTG